MRVVGLFAIALSLVPVASHAQNADSLELVRLEVEWNRAHVQGDTAALNRLWAPSLTVIVPEMPPMSKDDLLGFWRSGRSNISTYDTDELTIRLIGDAAVVTGRLCRERNFNGQLVADDWRFTKVYSRRDGVWRVIAYHASVAAKPSPQGCGPGSGRGVSDRDRLGVPPVPTSREPRGATGRHDGRPGAGRAKREE